LRNSWLKSKTQKTMKTKTRAFASSMHSEASRKKCTPCQTAWALLLTPISKQGPMKF